MTVTMHDDPTQENGATKHNKNMKYNTEFLIVVFTTTPLYNKYFSNDFLILYLAYIVSLMVAAPLSAMTRILTMATVAPTPA